MRERNTLIAYLLIGFGIYFLIKQLNFTFFQSFVGWPTIVAIIGLAFLLHSYTAKVSEHILIGSILVGFGIHFHGLHHYVFWYDHWSVYTLIVGIAYFIFFFKTKKGFMPAVILVSLSVVMLFSITLPDWFKPIYGIIDFIETFWPVLLIGLGIYFLWRK